MRKSKYPRDKDTVRPYRIWNAKQGKQLLGKNYSNYQKAHDGALVYSTRWAKVGETWEVIDVVRGKCYGQYTRKLESTMFLGDYNHAREIKEVDTSATRKIQRNHRRPVQPATYATS